MLMHLLHVNGYDGDLVRDSWCIQAHRLMNQDRIVKS